MQTESASLISLDEVATTLGSYAGPGRPRRRPQQQRRWFWRLTLAAVTVALVSIGAVYAAGLGSFPGISAANHPATSNDALPEFLVTGIASFSSEMERMGHGHLLVDTVRYITELPSGMRFYTIATSAGGLCLATVDPPGSNAKGGMGCGESLSPSHPITIETERANQASPPVSYGLAMDGVIAVSFTTAGAESAVPVTDNVWAYEGQADLTSVTVHWADGNTQTLVNGK